MNIDVSFPIKTIRYIDNASHCFNASGSFSAGTVEVIEGNITITKLTSPTDQAIISLRYKEDFNPEEGLRCFFERAEKHAYDYLDKLAKSTTTYRIVALD